MRITLPNLGTIAATDWEEAREYLRQDLEGMKSAINTIWEVSHKVDGTQKAGTFGAGAIIQGTSLEQPTNLTAANDGLLFYVTDFGHLVRYNAASQVWEFAPGDNGAGYFADFGITPQATGWQLCDGSATTYLHVGAALTTVAFVTPNLTGTPAYRKAAAAYTGTINAKVAPSTTGTGSTGTGTTSGQSNDHGHNFSVTSGGPSAQYPANVIQQWTAGASANPPTASHTHDSAGTTGGTNSDHTHSAPSLSVPALSIGTIEMANLGVLPFFRR